jgi:hypothetical protein
VREEEPPPGLDEAATAATSRLEDPGGINWPLLTDGEHRRSSARPPDDDPTNSQDERQSAKQGVGFIAGGSMFLVLMLALGCGEKDLTSDDGPIDADGDGYADDCDDSNASVFPGAVEICDGLDNNCDGIVDNEVSDGVTWYVDGDVDGFGNPDSSVMSCERPDGLYVANDWDCDDTNGKTNPNSYEICDGVDNDCNGEVDDDAINASTWYGDGDLDGHGDPEAEVVTCDQPDNTVTSADDCDDADANAYPGATEVWYNGVDEDCNGGNDYDQDGDGVDSDQWGGTDCDDTDATVAETCSLYEFDDHTFTTCGASGRYGPTLSECRNSYETDWDTESDYFDMDTQGIQKWTVPEDGDYELVAVGAGAGLNTSYSSYPGRGVRETGTFTLEKGEILFILAGHQGQTVTAHAGAGGGSFVVQSDFTPLVIAGGGGAPCRGDYHLGTQDATSSNSGVSSTCSGGSGGDGGSSCSGSYGPGGGGLTGDGGNGPADSTGGRSFISGGQGGQCYATCGSNSGAGGFGGGGGTYHDVYGGGGGGYSGGGGGDYCQGGGGGASYNSGDDDDSDEGYNSGAGWVSIERL